MRSAGSNILLKKREYAPLVFHACVGVKVNVGSARSPSSGSGQAGNSTVSAPRSDGYGPSATLAARVSTSPAA